MELPALPDGTAVQSHTDWLTQSPANQVAFYNHWDHNSESVVPIHVTHPGLVPWVPLLGGEASPHDPNVVALDLHVLDAIFARCFVVNDATVAARLHGHWLIAPARYGEVLTGATRTRCHHGHLQRRGRQPDTHFAASADKRELEQVVGFTTSSASRL